MTVLLGSASRDGRACCCDLFWMRPQKALASLLVPRLTYLLRELLWPILQIQAGLKHTAQLDLQDSELHATSRALGDSPQQELVCRTLNLTAGTRCISSVT